MSGDKISEPSVMPEKSIVLYKSKWNDIVRHLQRGDDLKLASEADQQYKQYLYEGSRAMTDKWKNSLKATIREKEAERVKIEQQKIDEAAERFRVLKESDQMKRFEENIKAINQQQKQKMGPFLLESAYITSECVAVRDIQRNANAQLLKIKKEREAAMGRDAIAQDEQYAEQQKIIMKESRRKQDEYKKELRLFIEDKERKQADLKKIKCEEERLENNRIDNDLAAQLSKERRILEKKKEAKRLIALEAMQMAEKRRIREKQMEELENQVATIFANGNIIDQVKQQNEMELKRAKEEFQKNAWQTALADIKNLQSREDENIKLTVEEFQAKLKFKDQAKVEERRRIKQLQIKNHLDDIARQKIRKQREEIERKRDVENRIQNEKVNVQFDREKRLETLNRVKEHRRIILEQIEERKQAHQERDYSDLIALNKMNENEDKAFFDYANELVNDAKEKGRSIYPLITVVKDYKQTNNLSSKKLIYDVNQLKAMRPTV